MKKEIKRTRTEIPHIRFRKEEIDKLKEDFEKTKFSNFSSYIRFLIFSKKLDVSFSSTESDVSRMLGERNKRLSELNRQILKIGININQAVKKINSQQYVMREDMEMLQKQLESIEKAMKNLNRTNGEVGAK